MYYFCLISDYFFATFSGLVFPQLWIGKVLFLSNIIICMVVIKINEIFVIELLTLQFFSFLPFICYSLTERFALEEANSVSIRLVESEPPTCSRLRK
jgi:hypothetical protein